MASCSTFGLSTTSDEVAEHFKEEIRGKTVLITGTSPGSLGYQFALSITPHNPHLLILANRDSSKTLSTISSLTGINPSINARPLILDLSSQKQIREAVKELLSWGVEIDVIVNNAGVMAVPEYRTTEEGIEWQLACNHVGHFLLTNLLISHVLKEEKGKADQKEGTKKKRELRIVNITSNGHIINGVRYHDPNFLRGAFYNKWISYGQSKTANILFTKYLAAKFSSPSSETTSAQSHHPINLTAISLHPGQIITNLGESLEQADVEAFGWNRPDKGDFLPFLRKELNQGAAGHVVAAFDPGLKGSSGCYLRDCQVHDEEVAEWARSDEGAEKLWKMSEGMVGEDFAW